MNQNPIVTQVSAGGVAYRQAGQGIVIALILVGPHGRWQLPKGTVNRNEGNEAAAQREVKEEAGISTDLIELIDRIEYWFYATRGGKRTRFHKFVYFYLLRYHSGNVEDHDHEVDEARWVDIDQSIEMLAFESEKEVVRKAKQMILGNQ